MGRTYKDESSGAYGKFRNRQRSHDKRLNTGKQQVEPVFSEPFEDKDEIDDPSSKWNESKYRNS